MPPLHLPPLRAAAWPVLALVAALSGCAAVGPDFQAPVADSPPSWSARSSSAPELSGALAPVTEALPQDWVGLFGDPVLDTLRARAFQANPDLQKVALRMEQSRLQRRMVASQAAPQADANARAARQRQSEHAPETRLVGAMGGADTPQLIQVLSEPFDLYQAGFDFSWELDLWGRVRRSEEVADAEVEGAGAQRQDAQLMLAAELSRAYFELRGIQRRQALLARDIEIAQSVMALQRAQADGGLTSRDPLLTQAQSLAALQASHAAALAQQATVVNQIGLLTGDPPGALNELLAPRADDLDADLAPDLPALTLGQPSDLLRRRPDVRAAEARLHAATAQIGVAVADLYPRIALGASAGVQAMAASTFTEWGSRAWQVGPALSLPLFDRGRRQAQVELRRKEQQIAAVAWRQTVLKAWQELDDALNDHAAERRRHLGLSEREAAAREQYSFARARAASGLMSELAPLQAELAWRQTQADLAGSDSQLRVTLVRVFKAAGGGLSPSDIALSKEESQTDRHM